MNLRHRGHEHHWTRNRGAAQDALFEAACWDATLGLSDGVQTAVVDGRASDCRSRGKPSNAMESAVPGARAVEMLGR